MTRNDRLMPGILCGLLGLILLRALTTWLPVEHWKVFAHPEVEAYLQTEPATPAVTTEPSVTETQNTEPIPTTPSNPLVMPEVSEGSYDFETSDTSFVKLNYSANRKPDIKALLTQPLRWDLTVDEPTVLILHSHGTEAFLPTVGYTYEEEGGEYRTTAQDCNMLSLGEELARLLNAAGIHTVQDRAYYDYPDYLSSYDNARSGTQELLKKYPSVKLVIDLHRDSAEREDGTQWATNATINGEKSAQVMLVIGTDSYYTHPDWEQNLSVALKLTAIMEKTHPGSTRPLDLRKQRFNQDLSTGAIIAEIGAAGNTHREAMNAVSVLAEAIILLAKGTN